MVPFNKVIRFGFKKIANIGSVAKFSKKSILVQKGRKR
ncbi:hypothetical protein LK231_0674 [Lactococcus lactis subsp. lactis]|nr:hypothetical protein LK231_0674 [Lactococcus lactis subsp. lactis]